MNLSFMYDDKISDDLTKNLQAAYTKEMDFGKGAREAVWAAEQRTLDSL